MTVPTLSTERLEEIPQDVRELTFRHYDAWMRDPELSDGVEAVISRAIMEDRAARESALRSLLDMAEGALSGPVIKASVLASLKEWVAAERESGDRILRVEMEGMDFMIRFYEQARTALTAINTAKGTADV